uniref:Uncharacterized protein n=1 Tax=Stegastes partitus TaxID=144197 RepID=A0A3B4ZQG7_9TELE
MAASAASRELFTEGVRAVLHTWPVLQVSPGPVSVRLLQLFSQWQQGALQPLKHTINTLTQNQNQRAKVTAPTSQSDDDSDDGAQVTPTHRFTRSARCSGVQVTLCVCVCVPGNGV